MRLSRLVLLFAALSSASLAAFAAAPVSPVSASASAGASTQAGTSRVPSVKLTPQAVVDRVLEKGLRAKSAELQAKRSYYAYDRALGNFDYQLSGTVSYEHNQAQTLSGNSNPVDRTFTFNSVLSKKLTTGTTLSLGFDNISQNSTLSSFSQSTRSPVASLDAVTFTLRQALLSNSFGLADRLAVEAAESQLAAADEARRETLEGVILDDLTLFWSAYVAQEQLKANMLARDKYDELVKNVRRKAGFNLSTPGELPRLEAELNNADSRVKSSSADYLSAVDSLLTAVKGEPGGEVQFEVPETIPPVPQLKPKDIESLRVVKIARTNVVNAERGLRSIHSQGLPKLDLVARAKSTGVDEERGRALAEMSGGNYPTYYIGLEFATAIGSRLLRGAEGEAEVQLGLARNELELQADALTNQLRAAERRVVSSYTVAKSSGETVQFRERVVRELESSYRQGRQPLVELIRAYNDLFSAQLDRARAIGQYQIALDQLAAARDELIPDGR